MNTTETEKSPEYTATVVATLGDLNLGNPNGIPSQYKGIDKEVIQADAEQMLSLLKEPSDKKALRCIDGRHTNNNADGSTAELRLAHVGGTASNFGIAFNADAAALDTLSDDDSFGRKVHIIDALVAEKTGFDRSAHLGGCGGANGEVADNEAINSNPHILAATETFMDIPQVKAYFEASFDPQLAERVRENAGLTANFLKEAGWDGQVYVDGVRDDNPSAVEDLEVDHDHEFHGHREDTLVVIIGDKTLDMDDAFEWNLKATKDIALALAGERGHEGYVQALIADVAKHMAVANRLPGRDTPVILLTDN